MFSKKTEQNIGGETLLPSRGGREGRGPTLMRVRGDKGKGRREKGGGNRQRVLNARSREGGD